MIEKEYEKCDEYRIINATCCIRQRREIWKSIECKIRPTVSRGGCYIFELNKYHRFLKNNTKI